MQLEACYRNFLLSFESSKHNQQIVVPDENFVGYAKQCPVVEENVVFPVPNYTTPIDFANSIVDDANFQNREEPFYVIDLSRILAQHQIWLQNLPRVEPFYAVKCNNHKVLLAVLASLGVNFDCASKGEIESVLELGVNPERIIYANPCKTASYIKHAADRNVRMMTFDNEQELYKIMRIYPNSELILRIAVSDPTALCPLNLKFGCEPEEAAPALLKLAATLGANVIGISFHVGSGCRDPSAFALGVSYARHLFNVGLQLGLNMHLLDLGGGYPGYKTELPFETIADVINRALEIHFPDDEAIRIIAEPGRFYAAACFTLCCTVVARTQVSADRVTKNAEDKDEIGFMYYINDGVYGSFNCILYDHVHPVGAPLKTTNPAPLTYYPSAVWGPTCDSLDLVQPNVQLPEMLEGQWMVFENMGAYTFAAGSEFNGFPRPTCCYIVSENDSPILTALCSSKMAKIQMPTVASGAFVALEKDVMMTRSGNANAESDDDAASVASCSNLSSGAISSSSGCFDETPSDDLDSTN